MATSRDELKSYFKQFSTPTESQFAKLIDSAPNLNDDGLEKSAGTPLKIQAGSDGTLQEVVAFYKSFANKDTSADWTIQLKAPGAGGASGLAIVKGGGTVPVLFIDEASGKIGVNTTSPEASLDVKGVVRLREGLNIEGTVNARGNIELQIIDNQLKETAGIFFQNKLNPEKEHQPYIKYINVADRVIHTTTTAPIGNRTTSGELIISNPKGSITLDAYLSIKLTGPVKTPNVLTVSDEREKTDIEALPYGLNAVCDLKPVSYNWKNRPNPKRSIGLIAQEVDTVIQEATHLDEDNSSGHGWCISYNSLIPVLINAIKELDQKVKDLQGKK